jgi:site-specific DNA recombinase
MHSVIPRERANGSNAHSLLRIAFYVRVSSEEQTERATAKNQLDFLRKKYQPNFEPDSLEPMEFVGAFVDDGESGAKPLPDRPAGRKLLDLVRARGVDVVVAYRLDRLGRKLTVLLDAHEELERHGVAILSATEPFDTRTPIGQFLFQLLGSMAQLERETIRERFTMGRDRHAREGKFINGAVPIGYDLDESRTGLVPSERTIPQLGDITEADLVRMIFDRAAAGEGAAKLTLWLRSMGVPSTRRFIRRPTSKRGSGETQHVYAEWNAARVQDLIHSTIYYGKRTLNYKSATVHQEWPALVTREKWDAAQVTLRDHVSNFNAGQNEGYVYLLTGRVFCTVCGGRMAGNYRRPDKRFKGTATRLYYGCASAKTSKAQRRPGACQSAKNHDGYALEAMVLDAIDEYVANPDAALKILRDQARARQGDSVQQEAQAKGLRLRLADYERGKQDLLTMVSRGEISREDYLAQVAARADEANAIRHELELVEAQDAYGAVVETRLLESVRVLHELRDQWAAARAADDRVALRTMVQSTLREIRLTPEGEAHIVFAFTPPASRENNATHYEHLFRDESVGRPVDLTGLLDLRLERSLAKPA